MFTGEYCVRRLSRMAKVACLIAVCVAGCCGHGSVATSPGQRKGYPASPAPAAQTPPLVAPAPAPAPARLPPPAPPVPPPAPRVVAPVEPAPAAPPRPMPLTPQGPRFAVRGVDRNDVLNVRSEPGPKGQLAGTIPPEAKGVLTTGKTRKLGPSIWREVIYGEVRGWVNDRFLVEERE